MNRCRWLVLVILCLGSPLAMHGGEKHKNGELSKQEKEILDLTNRERKNKDLPPLRVNSVLVKVARGHSQNMAKQEKMDHVLDGKNPYERIKSAGYRYYHAGENVASGNVSAKDIMEAWMKSKIHRDNILRKEYTEIGIGIVKDEKGMSYYTQVFGRPRK
jgi:uncharacterized protein YkwD